MQGQFKRNLRVTETDTTGLNPETGKIKKKKLVIKWHNFFFLLFRYLEGCTEIKQTKPVSTSRCILTMGVNIVFKVVQFL